MRNKDLHLNLPRYKKNLEDITMEEVISILRKDASSGICDIYDYDYICPGIGGCINCIIRPKTRKDILTGIKKKTIQKVIECQS